MKPRGIGNFKDVGERSKDHKVKNCETDLDLGRDTGTFVDQIVILNSCILIVNNLVGSIG